MTIQTTAVHLESREKRSCEPCLQQLLLRAEGVQAVDITGRGSSLVVTYDDSCVPSVREMIAEAQSKLEQQFQHETLLLTGLDCADCATTLKRGVERLPGIIHVNANFATSKMNVAYHVGLLDHRRIAKRIQELGYGVMEMSTTTAGTAVPVQQTTCGPSCSCERTQDEQEQREGLPLDQQVLHTDASPQVATDSARVSSLSALWQRYAKWLPTATAAVLWTVAFALGYLSIPALFPLILYGLAMVIGGYRIARSGFFALLRGHTLGIDLLMTIAVIGAALLGDWAEGAAVVVLFSVGELLEGWTMERVRRSIRGLMELAPREATIKTPQGERRVSLEALKVGEHMIVRPGERIAADGKVCEGSSSVNQAPITGESIPAEKQVGDEVYAGTLNEHGSLEVEVTCRAQDSTLAKIITLVQEAQGTRAPSQRFVDQFAHYYTPAVLCMAVLVALVPPLLLGAPFQPWLYKALVLLVIACPCALVISTPVAIVAAIGRASRSGILIKGGASLEALGRLKAMAFDKTGTLTTGRPVVTDILPLAWASSAEILTLAASVEARSEHPLARAILEKARAQAVSWSEPASFQALAGQGAKARVGEETVVIGSSRLFENLSTPIQSLIARLQQEGKTVLLLARSNVVLGVIAVADQLRPEAAQVVKQLRGAGIMSLVMLTGDNERTAQAVSQPLGIDDLRANLLPSQKMQAIKELALHYRHIAMIGDGINDAPALASATVGIAMGAAGSDTAIETADVALMTDDLSKLPFAVRLSRAARNTIKTNVTFSLVVKALFLVLTLLGLANLWLAILADTGAALIVIAYGMRLLGFCEKPSISLTAPSLHV